MTRPTLVLAALLFPLACQSSSRPARLIEQVEDARMTERELRLRVHDYAREFGAAVEATATEIAEGTHDRYVRRRALLWQMTAIPACFGAASHVDPVAALLDVWALAVQMRAYLEEGDGRDMYGEFQPLAVQTARELERVVERLAESVPASGDATRGRARVHEWAAEHPMRGPLFARPSTAADVSALTREAGLGTMRAVRRMEEHLGALVERMSLYVDHLPRQARWQGAYLLLHFLDTEAVAKVLEDVDRLAASVAALERGLGGLPGRLTDERKAAVEALQEERALALNEAKATIRSEREAVLREIDRQRGLAFESVREERKVVLKEVRDLQEQTVAALRDERKVVLEAVHQERLETMDRAEAIARAAVDDAMTRAEGLIDYLFWRALPFGGVAVALVLGLAFWVRKRDR